MSGPSGVGKGTIREKLMENNDINLFYSVSMTTRLPRPGETNGKEYYFVTREEFEENIKSGNLLEWAEFVGNCYGTPKDKVEEKRNEGKNVLLEIDVNGTTQVLDKVSDAISIFVTPPTLEELENRIRNRKTESDEVIKTRLERARKEIEFKKYYKYVVVNDNLEDAVKEIRDIIKNNMED